MIFVLFSFSASLFQIKLSDVPTLYECSSAGADTETPSLSTPPNKDRHANEAGGDGSCDCNGIDNSDVGGRTHRSNNSPADGTSCSNLHPPDLVLQLCDGTEVDGFVGVSIINRLVQLGIPFTGARAPFYHLSTSKVQMKAAFKACGVPTAPWIEYNACGGVETIGSSTSTITDTSSSSCFSDGDDDALIKPAQQHSPRQHQHHLQHRHQHQQMQLQLQNLSYPLIIKPDNAYDSIGLTDRSIVQSPEAAWSQLQTVRQEHGSAFAEEFVEGREFTVLVLGDAELGVDVWVPVERVFNKKAKDATGMESFDQIFCYMIADFVLFPP